MQFFGILNRKIILHLQVPSCNNIIFKKSNCINTSKIGKIATDLQLFKDILIYFIR